MTDLASADVLVIGAGPAGIASAYALQQTGIACVVVDRADTIGATWASLYPSLRLNTSRYFSHMPGLRFPAHYGLFATGAQYHEYLVQFVQRHQFSICLGIQVERVAPEGNDWRVETSMGVFHYRAVILATGLFGQPIMPDIPGMDAFTGRLLHAHDFTDPAILQDQRVLVVGNGPSGVDIAVASGQVARQTAISIRNGISLRRHYPLGLAQHTWLLFTQFLPRPLCRVIMGWLGRLGYPDQERYGLPRPRSGTASVTAYQGPELLSAVKAGRVQPIPAAPARFEGDTVFFSDGRQQAFDVVIMATGYTPVFMQYLDIDVPYDADPWQAGSICDWEIGPNGQRGWPLRDTSAHPNGRQVLGYPGLYIVGTYYKGKGALYNMNVEAAVAAEQIAAYLAMPAQARRQPA